MSQQRVGRGWRATLLRIFIVLLVLTAFVVLHSYVESLSGDDLQQVSVFAGLIAALAGAIAAAAALLTARASERAAQRSAQTAEDASKALAMATRPDPGFNISRFSPGEVTNGTAEIQLENRSQWPLVDPVITWSCRGGLQGSVPLPTLSARTTPYGSGFVQDPPRAVHEIKDIDTTRPGTDQVTVEFGTQYGPQRWSVTKGWTYGDPDQGQLGPKLVGQLEPVVRQVVTPRAVH